jgi:hypothetical protein
MLFDDILFAAVQIEMLRGVHHGDFRVPEAVQASVRIFLVPTCGHCLRSGPSTTWGTIRREAG